MSNSMALSPDFDDDISDVSPGDEHVIVPLNDRGIVFLDGDEENDADGSEQRLKKRGRKTGDVWEVFTEAFEPHKAKSNKCMHCNMLINYHRKIESAKVHLNKCSPFRKLMNGMEDADRPDWYVRNAQTKASQKQKPSLSSPRVSAAVGRAR
jgi:hypothetical protein